MRNLLAVCIVTVVHLVVLAVFLGGIWLIAALHNPISIAGGVVCVAIAVLLRPRPARLRAAAVLLDPAVSPTLHAVAARVAEELGTPPVSRIAFDPGNRAEFARVGWRGHRTLVIGLPLWSMLGEQEKIAVLARGAAYTARGELRSRVFIASALESMRRFLDALRGPVRGTGSEHVLAFTAQFGTLPQFDDQMWISSANKGGKTILWLFGYPALWLLRGEESLLAPDSERAARHADRRCAQLTGARAVVSLLEKETLGEPAMTHIRNGVLRGTPDPLGSLPEWLAGLSHADRDSIVLRDKGIPSAAARIAPLCEVALAEGFTVSAAEWGRAEEELCPLLDPVRKAIHDWAIAGSTA